MIKANFTLFVSSAIFWIVFYTAWRWYGQNTFLFGQAFVIWGSSVMIHSLSRVLVQKDLLSKVFFNKRVRDFFIFFTDLFVFVGWNQIIDFWTGSQEEFNLGEYVMATSYLLYIVGKYYPKTLVGKPISKCTFYVRLILDNIFSFVAFIINKSVQPLCFILIKIFCFFVYIFKLIGMFIRHKIISLFKNDAI